MQHFFVSLSMISQLTLPALPDSHSEDVKRAISILRETGCDEVYLFGSLSDGTARPDSDIDLAVRGLPAQKFFSVYGRLMRELAHGVDLVNLDTHTRFASFLEQTDALIRVA